MLTTCVCAGSLETLWGEGQSFCPQGAYSYQEKGETNHGVSRSDGQRKGKGGWEALSVGWGNYFIYFGAGLQQSEWLCHYFIT